MSKRKTCYLVKLAAVMFVTLCTTQFAVGQNSRQPDDKETLQQLLTEVRILRQAMQILQRMSLDTYQTQVMVDRIRANREDVRRLTASLSETRDLITKNQAAIPEGADEQKLLEGQIQLEIDPNKRAQLEFELKRSKKGVELYKSQIDALKEREQELSTELRAERSKLDELESRLDLLERAIENDRQKLETDKPAPEKKP